MTTIKNSIDFLTNYCKFSPNEVFVLVGIVRNKDKNDKNEKRAKWMRRLILRSPQDIPSCYHDIKAMGDEKGVTYRMYVSQNSRDVTKTIFNFQPELIKVGYDLIRNNEQAIDRIKRIDSMWKTELLQNRNRGTRRFLLDVDSQKPVLIADIQDHLCRITKVHAIRETVSGYHIVFDACDTRGFMQAFKDEPIEIQRDSLVFIETWEGDK